MSAMEMKAQYTQLYDHMAQSNDLKQMKTFGNVMGEMMEWFIQNKPDVAQDWIDQLESIKWKNYLTAKEADRIVAGMVPAAPWSREKWLAAMTQHELPTEHEPAYNRCALYVTMCMIMSDSGDTLPKYIESGKLFNAVHDLAVDKLTDKDGVFCVRSYFGL